MKIGVRSLSFRQVIHFGEITPAQINRRLTVLTRLRMDPVRTFSAAEEIRSGHFTVGRVLSENERFVASVAELCDVHRKLVGGYRQDVVEWILGYVIVGKMPPGFRSTSMTLFTVASDLLSAWVRVNAVGLCPSPCAQRASALTRARTRAESCISCTRLEPNGLQPKTSSLRGSFLCLCF